MAVETRFVGELTTELAEARVELLGSREEAVSLADERQYALSFLNKRLEDRQKGRLEAGQPPISARELEQIRESVMATAFDASRMWRLWTNEYAEAENMWANGTDPCFVQFPGGKLVQGEPLADTDEELERSIRLLRAKSTRPDQPWDHLNHQLELVIQDDGTRVTATNYVAKHPFVTFRRPTLKQITLDDLVDNDTMSQSCAEFLDAAVKTGLRIMIGGSMNTGKTVLLRALAASLPTQWITVTAESQGELMLGESAGDVYPDFVLELEARKAGADGHGEVSLNQLIEDAQRLSPDCVIIGEVRGEESKALSKAVSQGYMVMATIHAYSAREAISNAGLYLEQYTGIATGPALRRMADGIDLSIFMEKQANGKRRVAEVIAVMSGDEGRLTHHTICDHNGQMSPVPERLKVIFERNGYQF